ncbi:MAG: carboxyl-terminal processing protease [Thermoleophilaceae bacterium]|nr:carboxyl-terminal processing protease [Thermoleophilaceae bacterium]
MGLLAVVLVALLGGIALGGHPNLLPGFIRDAFVGDKQAQVVREALDKIHDVYYRPIPDDKLADAAIAGMVSSLHDRFSNYLSPQDYRRFKEITHSAYEGVGMEVDKARRGLRVIAVYDGSPAKRAGIRPGDVVLAANGVSLAGKTSARGSGLIKGPPGTQVTLRVLHAGSVKTLKVSRARVTVPVVASQLKTVRGKKLGVVRLATFSSGAHAEFDAALKKLLGQGAKGVVVDLRGNGGGLVSEAQLIASAFLHGGTVVTTGGRAVGRETLKAIGTTIVPARDPVVVLVDHNTASASEIVTGALQDRHRAEVVGVPTFGKGVFQQIMDLSNGGALDITAGQYFTPSGRNLGGRGVQTGAGIKPDVTAKDDPKTTPDEGLRKALAVLAAKVA